jgi:hypothetical protein
VINVDAILIGLGTGGEASSNPRRGLGGFNALLQGLLTGKEGTRNRNRGGADTASLVQGPETEYLVTLSAPPSSEETPSRTGAATTEESTSPAALIIPEIPVKEQPVTAQGTDTSPVVPPELRALIADLLAGAEEQPVVKTPQETVEDLTASITAIFAPLMKDNKALAEKVAHLFSLVKNLVVAPSSEETPSRTGAATTEEAVIGEAVRPLDWTLAAGSNGEGQEGVRLLRVGRNGSGGEIAWMKGAEGYGEDILADGGTDSWSYGARLNLVEYAVTEEENPYVTGAPKSLGERVDGEGIERALVGEGAAGMKASLQGSLQSSGEGQGAERSGGLVSPLVERIAKMAEARSGGAVIPTFLVRLRLGENEEAVIVKMREIGDSIRVEIKSVNQEIAGFLKFEKQQIERQLEARNVPASIRVNQDADEEQRRGERRGYQQGLFQERSRQRSQSFVETFV